MDIMAGACRPADAAGQVQIDASKKRTARRIAGAKKQLDIIKKLFDEATEIIVATERGARANSSSAISITF